MPIKAEIVITDKNGQIFEGTAELHPRNDSGKRKTPAVAKNKSVKKARSKIIIRLRQFISGGFFNKTTKRTIREIRQKFRAKGMTLKNTQLQPYLTQMVVNDELEREQVTRDGKRVFLYYKI
jgi:hypothetical protein